MEVKKHELIEQNLCSALDEYENKLRQGQKMSSNDYEQLKIIYSALVKKKAYEGMLEYEGYGDEDLSGYSGRQMRSPVTGRYVSGNSYANGNSRTNYEDSYASGYASGYSEAMAQNQSGHYPMMQNNYPPRRW